MSTKKTTEFVDTVKTVRNTPVKRQMAKQKIKPVKLESPIKQSFKNFYKYLTSPSPKKNKK